MTAPSLPRLATSSAPAAPGLKPPEARWRLFFSRTIAALLLIVGCSFAAAQSFDGDLLPSPAPAGADEYQLGPSDLYASVPEDEPSSAGVSDNLSLEDRLKELEERYNDLQENYDKLSEDQDSIKDDMKTLATSGHSGATMQVNGRIHVDHWAFPGDSPGVNAFENGDPNITPQDRLQLRRLRFGVEGDIWENMEYCLDLELSEANDPQLRDTFIGFKELPVLQRLLIGIQKRPYGLDHINSSRYNIFLERPFVVEAFNQDNRRLGVQSWGHTEDLEWNWRYGVFNPELLLDDGAYISDHYQPELAGRLANTFFWNCGGRDYGHWAIAGSIVDADGSDLPGRATNVARFRTRPEARTESRWLDTGVIDGANDYGLLALENVWNFGPLQVVGEYQTLSLDRDAPTDLEYHGGYAYIAYVLTGEHVPWDRETGQLGRLEPFTYFYPFTTCVDGQRTGWGALQVAYRASYGDLSDDDVLGGVGEAHTAALLWYWNPWAKMVFNATYGEIDEHAPVAGQTFGDYTAIGTRFMVDF